LIKISCIIPERIKIPHQTLVIARLTVSSSIAPPAQIQKNKQSPKKIIDHQSISKDGVQKNTRPLEKIPTKEIPKIKKNVKGDVVDTKHVPSKKAEKKYPPTVVKHLGEPQKISASQRMLEASAANNAIASLPATAASATTTKNEDSSRLYEQQLLAWLNQYKYYPSAAQKRRQQGIVTVAFTINAKGYIQSYTIETTSGYKLLDKAVIKMLKRANPMPNVPVNLQGSKQRFSYAVPIVFGL
jgi:protein TonB